MKIHIDSVVVAVIRGHTRMLSVNFGRSQGIRRMLSAFNKTYNYFVGHDIVGQIKHCKMCLHATKPEAFILYR